MIKSRDLNHLLFFAIAVLIFFSGTIVLFSRTYYIRDLTYIFHPWKSLCSEMIQKGEMPLWNPYAYCGMPLLANLQSAVFYPFSILFYFFSFPIALKMFHYFHLLLAGFYAYLFARNINLSKWASSGTMIVFAFNGFLITKLEFLSHIGVDIWTFAILLFYKHPIFLALCVAMTFFGGHQVFFIQLFILFLYSAFSYSYKNPKSAIKNIIFFGIVSFGMTAIQLLPTIELTTFSRRAKLGIDASIAMIHSLKYINLVKIISPFIDFSSINLVEGEHFQWDTTLYIGIISTLTVIYGLFYLKIKRKTIFSFFLIFLGVILSLGDNTPIYPWIYKHIFFFKTMRYPVQFDILIILGLIMLIGESLNSIKFRNFIVPLILLELLITGFNFQPTSTNDYFYHKSSTVNFLQKNLGNNRFILSPGTEKNRFIKGKNTADAWQHARGYLYNLTCLPYHLYDAYGFGEPLTLYSIESFIDKTYRKITPQHALPDYEKLGIKYLLCRNKLKNTDGYKLIKETPVFIYQITNFTGLFKTDSENNTAILLNKPGKTVLEINSYKKSDFIWKEPYYPGWKLYLNNKLSKITMCEDLFGKWQIDKGLTTVYKVYDPLSFKIGALLTIFTLLILGISIIGRITLK